MGKSITEFYRKKVKLQWKWAFMSTFIIGFLVHIYKFTNTLLNHDSLYNFYSTQNIVGSGRWFLSIACGFSSFFDLPWVNGLFSIILIALTMVVIVEVFKIENHFLIVLISGALVAFPGITETFYFQFTSDGYMLAMLLAALTVYFSTFEKKGFKWISISILCICLSCGIYQAYVSFALLMTIFYFINELLEKRRSDSECFRYIGKQIIIFAIGMILYYIIWQVCMAVQGVEPTSYQGIDELNNLGQLGFSPLWFLKALYNCIFSIIVFFVEWNIFEHGINLFGLINILICILFVFGVFQAIRKSGLYKRKVQLILVFIALFLIIPCTGIWYFASPTIIYRPMMLISLYFIYMDMALMYDRWFKERISNIAGIVMIFFILNSAIIANIGYYYMHECYEKSYAMALEMSMDIHDIQDDYSFKKIAVVGNRSEETALAFVDEHANKVHSMVHLLENDLLYDQEHVRLFLENIFDESYEYVSNDEINQLESDERVKNMRIWPSEKSMQVIDDILIIKIGSDSKE